VEDDMIWRGEGIEGSEFVSPFRRLLLGAAAAGFAVAVICATATPSAAGAAAACETIPPLNTLDMTQPLNLGELKQQIRHYACSGAYDSEIAKVVSEAQIYVEQRAGQVVKPAIVLDIDETSLSNFPAILADDFGFIEGGTCDALPSGPCGWRKWFESARAEAITPMLTLFKAAKAKGVAVFFITGRRDTDDDRKWTITNLRDAGYEGWAGLSLRPVLDHNPSVIDYKSGERAKIAAQGYTIIANLGDQRSDLAGGHAERAYRLPNPFYFIP
jgi:acid phosphatase